MNLPFDLTSEKIHPLEKKLFEKINEIVEVNYKVGISSRSYFTKCFREMYGTSPSDFLKKRGTILS